MPRQIGTLAACPRCGTPIPAEAHWRRRFCSDGCRGASFYAGNRAAADELAMIRRTLAGILASAEAATTTGDPEALDAAYAAAASFTPASLTA